MTQIFNFLTGIVKEPKIAKIFVHVQVREFVCEIFSDFIYIQTQTQAQVCASAKESTKKFNLT